MWHTSDGLWASRFLCDICGSAIEETGAVSWRMTDDGPVYTEVLHTHKGRCHQTAEERLGGRMATGWVELSEHVRELWHNSHFIRIAITADGRREEPLPFDDGNG